MNRRAFTLSLLSTAALASCSSISKDPTREFRSDYAARVDGGFKLPAIPLKKVDKEFLRQVVDYNTKERPGTIVVDVPSRHLYLVQRRPDLAKWRKGMPPGLNNPLGPRALYLTKGGRDTLYRLHGTPEWWSIGKAVSSGCIRLMNQDIIDLHARVKPGAKVVVKQT